MKKYVILYVFVFFCFQPLLAYFEELELVINLKNNGRKAWDSFPELMPFYEANFNRLSEVLNQADKEQLDALDQLVREKFELHGLLLYWYMKAHICAGGILSKNHEWRQDFDSPMNKGGYDPLKMAYDADIFSLPVVNENGILSLSDLSHSYGNKTPLCALPLYPSSYDGFQDQPQASFFRHDRNHAMNNSIDFFKCKHNPGEALKNYYQKAELFYKMIDKNSLLDQFAYFYFIHEDDHLGKDFLSSKNHLTINHLLRAIKPLTYKINFSPYGGCYGILNKDHIALLTTTRIADLFKAFPDLNKTEPLCEKNSIKNYIQHANNSGIYIIFASYNVLFSYQEMLKDQGFQIWREDGELNDEGEQSFNNVLMRTLNEFVEKYRTKLQ